MGFKFRKSFKVAPGVKVNVSKKGIGTSVGGKYGRVSTSSRGTTVGGSIPGTGVSYSKTTGKGKKSTKEKNQQASGCLSGCLGCFGLIFIFGILFAACSAFIGDDPQPDDVATTKETETAPVEAEKDTTTIDAINTRTDMIKFSQSDQWISIGSSPPSLKKWPVHQRNSLKNCRSSGRSSKNED
ncbi:hypothetical protein BTO30_14115 [Domibacillus antri]|uniref:DUF4236 domain-containing protein n=1 Tax=Domibacillus antri TaxID=1714264 RepID=A0A1Q8Q2N8_9BACI|nr:DUF4236 domain-containing protein [Domibacillus antri]OLN21613.1 hypothetical protein BTO30_14115 [Domibacillus antri]